jgi:hypothetical protein
MRIKGMGVRLYGQLERDGERLVVRVLGHRVGTADGWFHWNGWTVIMPGFKVGEGLSKFFVDQTMVEAAKAVATLGLMVDYYSGQIALIEMPAKDQMSEDPRVIASAHIRV